MANRFVCGYAGTLEFRANNRLPSCQRVISIDKFTRNEHGKTLHHVSEVLPEVLQQLRGKAAGI